MSNNFTKYRLFFIASCCLLSLLSQAQLKINSFTPATARVGATVTITGTGFDPVAANNIVYFGGSKAPVSAATATQLVVTVPAGAAFLPIAVTKGGLTAYSQRPFISTFGCAPVAIKATQFSNKVDFSTGFLSSPISIAVADLDGDGKPDVASTNQDDNSVAIFKNTSTHSTLNAGALAAAVHFPTDAGPAGIAVGDLDGDGKADLAITTTSSSISILKNTSTTGAIDATSFAVPIKLATSANGPTDSAQTTNININDIDGDGKPDIIVTNSKKGTVSIFRNVGINGTINSSSFAAKFDLNAGANPIGLVTTDFDGDGRPEVMVNNAYGFTISMFRNTSTPGAISFAGVVNYLTQVGTAGLAAGDLNNDGKPELVITNTLDNSITIYPNNASPGSINFFSLGSGITLNSDIGPVTPVIGDFNGDGKPDIAISCFNTEATNSLSNPLSLYVNALSGSTLSSSSFLPRITMVTGGSFGRFSISDLDSDGKPDLVIPNYTADVISVLKNNISIFNDLPTATVNGLNTVCDDGVWKNFYDPAATDKIICSIRDNGNGLGTTNARVYKDAVTTKYNNTSFLTRHYLLTPANQPTTNVQVRLYFTEAEFNTLQAADNRILRVEDLSITKYQGPTEDGVFNPADATQLTIIPPSAITFGRVYGGYYADFSASGLSEIWFNYGTLALPVQLLYFKAEKLSGAVSLQWSTATETNNDYFTIERSADGVGYSAVATVKAGGPSSQPRVYETKDGAPLQGLNYYRLKQTDRDGKASYSEIKMVNWDEAVNLKVTIAPQPVKAQATVSFFAKAGSSKFVIYNALGVAVQNYRLDRNTNGNAQLTIHKNGLSAGLYFYKIFNGNQELYHGRLIVE